MIKDNTNDALNFLCQIIEEYFKTGKDIYAIACDNMKQKSQETADLIACSFYWLLDTTDNIENASSMAKDILLNNPDLAEKINFALQDLNQPQKDFATNNERTFLHEKTNENQPVPKSIQENSLTK